MFEILILVWVGLALYYLPSFEAENPPKLHMNDLHRTALDEDAERTANREWHRKNRS